MIGIGISTGECLHGHPRGRRPAEVRGRGCDAVNLAARVEGLTRHLGTLLITEQTRDALTDPGAFALRYVDRVQVKGLNKSTNLYEVLDGLGAAERERKQTTAGAGRARSRSTRRATSRARRRRSTRSLASTPTTAPSVGTARG